ncbi:hypothetical protein ACHAPT_001751, partial [Fusarium lateritium]
FILNEISKLLSPESVLSRDDVLAAWSGILPLVRDSPAKNTESLVRSHLITVPPSGLLTCAGGKWTTYRQMAEDTVDEAIKTFNLQPRAIPLPDISGAGLPGFTTSGICCTRNVPLVGAHGCCSSLASQLMEVFPIDADTAHHLATNYGDRAWALLAISTRLNTRLVSGLPFIEAEITHGVRAEAACTAADVIARRTRLSFLDASKALQVRPRVIDIMAEELHWTAARKEHELADTVGFLDSMGLKQDKITSAQEEELPIKASNSSFVPQQPTMAGGIEVDVSGLGAGQALRDPRAI